jgi:serine/threonine-protein kinase RsbW
VPLPSVSTGNAQCHAETVPFQDIAIPSDPAAARRVEDQIEQDLLSHKAASQDVFSIRLALDEALINAMKHGNQFDHAKNVTVSYRIVGNRFEVQIRDEGLGFDPSEVPDPTAIENLERPCGRGLMLMRHYMHEVNYRAGGNTVSMSRSFRIEK